MYYKCEQEKLFLLKPCGFRKGIDYHGDEIRCCLL